MEEKLNEEKKFFNKWCYICDRKFKVHFTNDEMKAIHSHYGSIKYYPRNNQMCLACNLKFQSLILRTPCKCRKCSKFFWMYKTHSKYLLAKEMFLEKKRFWYDFCPDCDIIYQKSINLQQLNPKPKARMDEKDAYFIYACKFLELKNKKNLKQN